MGELCAKLSARTGTSDCGVRARLAPVGPDGSVF
jgi:hypothetical protein